MGEHSETKKRKTQNELNEHEHEQAEQQKPNADSNANGECAEQRKRSSCCNTGCKAYKKPKEVAIFGNYRSYYGYRIGSDLEDPRLKVMKKEWFEGKDCLDIGCNSGMVTISIAQMFSCNSMLGIDIDSDRIDDATGTLRKIVRSISKTHSATNKSVAKEEEKNHSENGIPKSQSELRECNSESAAFAGRNLLETVSFQCGNFVGSWHPPAGKFYHTIICLSVTKWIHLNWGDDGLITLFSRVRRFLHPGGVFVVEPQPWTSYSNNRKVSEVASENYKSIQIGPEDFQDILLDKIGFRRVEHINSGLSGTKVGFGRPILAFWK